MARISSTVTSISWIPREAITGMSTKLPFEVGIAHYDQPPPDLMEDLEALRDADGFRFANRLTAWIEVNDEGKIIDWGHQGEGMIGSTRLKLGPTQMNFAAVSLPPLSPEPDVKDRYVRFTHTSGGRTGVPAPRRVKRKPYIQVAAPIAWTTVALTIHADGRTQGDLVGASPFPRHWVYDQDGKLILKSGVIDFEHWYRESFGEKTPWGDFDSPAVVAKAESEMERQVSADILQPGKKVNKRKLEVGDVLVEQGEAGDEIFLLMDGVLAVEIDGDRVAQVGPGAILGEMALLGEGKRNATLRALTSCNVIVVPGDAVDREKLAKIKESR